MANLVQSIHKSNSTSKNVFDLSNQVNFTTACGQLLPVQMFECLPNSEYRFNQSFFMRSLPLVVPSFARLKVHFDNFFVPYRLLGSDVQSIIVGNNRGMMSNYSSSGFTASASNKCLPYCSLSSLSPIFNELKNSGSADAVGNLVVNSGPILLNALGYGVPCYNSGSASPGDDNIRALNVGNSIHSVASSSPYPLKDYIDPDNDNSKSSFTSLKVSILPLLGYQKIYQDYYRNKLWEEENKLSYYLLPSDYGSDMMVNTLVNRGILEMRYHDYDKDRLIGVVPDVNHILSTGLSIEQAVFSLQNSPNNSGLDSSLILGSEQVPNSVSNNKFPNVSNADYTNFSALALRRLEAFQKFAEITELNKPDYKHQVKAHFGFNVPDLNSDYCQYLGGFESIFNITDIENTTSEQSGALSGKGTSSGQSRQFSFKTSEHGLFYTICYIVPEIDWSNYFTSRDCLHLNRYDFAIPEFDNLGFEPVRVMDYYNYFANPRTAVNNNKSKATTIVGYLPRYWSYKTRLDTCQAAFYPSVSDKRDSLNYGNYIIRAPYQRIIDNLGSYTFYRGLKSSPHDTDNMFSVVADKIENFPFIVTFYDNMSGMLPLSVSGLPY